MTRLASLHRAASSRVASPAMALLRFLPTSAWGLARAFHRVRRARTVVRAGRWRWVRRARRSGRSISPAACVGALSKLFPSIGWVPVTRPLPSCGSRGGAPNTVRAPASGRRSPTEVLEVLEGPLVAFLGFLSGVFPSAARATRFVLPGPSSFVLRAPPPVGGRHPAPWSLANGGVGWSLATADPSELRDRLNGR